MAKKLTAKEKAYYDQYWEPSHGMVRRKFDETGTCAFNSVTQIIEHLFEHAGEYQDYYDVAFSLKIPVQALYHMQGGKYLRSSEADLLASVKTDPLAARIISLRTAQKLKGI